MIFYEFLLPGLLTDGRHGSADWIPFDDGKTGTCESYKAPEDDQECHDEGEEINPFPDTSIRDCSHYGCVFRSAGGAQASAVELEESWRASLRRNRALDRSAGRALEGPHRSDLLVRHAPKQMDAALSSTGEQKALLIGIVLSHARLTAQMTGAPPILLLDEIAAHLDRGRREALFSIIDDIGAQAFMTGTDRGLFEALDGRAGFFSVAGGEVR